MPCSATELRIDGTRFVLDGKPMFLLGISYYGGLGARKEFVRADLDEARRSGFNWIRVWATWSSFGEDISAVDSTGAAREPYLGRLTELVRECDRRGMVVDVTLCRGNGTGPSKVANQDAHMRAVETICNALKRFRNWYLDLGNERNIRDARFVPFDDLAKLRAAARKICPWLLITASHGGDITSAELHDYLAVVDFITPHRPRGPESPNETTPITILLRQCLRAERKMMPVLYQEPFRRGYADWNPSAKDFLEDLSSARNVGAAGWCFHNGSERNVKDGRPRRSFDLRKQRLFDQLDSVERETIARIGKLYRVESESDGAATTIGCDVRRPARSQAYRTWFARH